MRWPFTTYATGTLLLCALPPAAASLALLAWAPGAWWILPLPVLAFALNFFRDPERDAPGGEDDLVSPADGVVADIVECHDPDLGLDVTRIGVFLSVFDVHVNRVPCTGTVERVTRREGGFLDARHARASEDNEAATLVLRRLDGRRVAVRQITGAIARRILCPVAEGAALARGERYGMIRFGSRTELCVPRELVASLRVQVGQRVQGGRSILVRLRPLGAAP